MTHDIDSFMEHFEYVKNMVGIDHVTFGPDCLYGDHVALHHAFAGALSTGDTSKSTLPYEEVPYVKYLENTTEASWNIPAGSSSTAIARRRLQKSSAATPSACCGKCGHNGRSAAMNLEHVTEFGISQTPQAEFDRRMARMWKEVEEQHLAAHGVFLLRRGDLSHRIPPDPHRAAHGLRMHPGGRAGHAGAPAGV